MSTGSGLFILCLSFSLAGLKVRAERAPRLIDPGLIYFSSYDENRSAFLEKAAPYKRDAWSDPTDAGLKTDLAFISKAADHPAPAETVVVFSSGLHGIEGYLGSSLQRWLLEHLSNYKPIKNDLVLIHALNPWGMKNKRRVNAQNVDLNRNFLKEEDFAKKENADYLKIDAFLNPTAKLELGYFHRLGFIFKSLELISSYSMETLRRSILLGQYSQEKGLYFGGRRSDPLKQRIDALLANQLSGYKKIIWVDLHTGYGSRNQLHLLANDSKSESGKKLRDLFPHTEIDFGDKKNFYKTEGDLVSYLNSKSSSAQEIQAIVFEYGTMNSQETLGSIESLRRMVIENQNFQQGSVNQSTDEKSKRLFEEMFFPQDSSWEVEVLSQTKQMWALLL